MLLPILPDPYIPICLYLMATRTTLIGLDREFKGAYLPPVLFLFAGYSLSFFFGRSFSFPLLLSFFFLVAAITLFADLPRVNAGTLICHLAKAFNALCFFALLTLLFRSISAIH